MQSGEFAKLTKKQRDFWTKNWGPAPYLKHVGSPMLWVCGSNDQAFYTPPWMKSVTTSDAERQLCLKIRWPHGHSACAEEVAEIATFMDEHLRQATPLLKVHALAMQESTLVAKWHGERPLLSANLLLTVDDAKNWPDNIWHEISVDIDRDSGTLSCELPPGTGAATFSLFDHDFNQVNSDVVFPFQT